MSTCLRTTIFPKIEHHWSQINFKFPFLFHPLNKQNWWYFIIYNSLPIYCNTYSFKITSNKVIKIEKRENQYFISWHTFNNIVHNFPFSNVCLNYNKFKQKINEKFWTFNKSVTIELNYRILIRYVLLLSFSRWKVLQIAINYYKLAIYIKYAYLAGKQCRLLSVQIWCFWPQEQHLPKMRFIEYCCRKITQKICLKSLSIFKLTLLIIYF